MGMKFVISEGVLKEDLPYLVQIYRYVFHVFISFMDISLLQSELSVYFMMEIRVRILY